MSWDELLKEGEKTVNIVKKGLIKRGLKAGNSIKTTYGTDEDIPIYNNQGDKLFWLSVKTVYGKVENPLKINFIGWMCGEVDSRQWCNPPAMIIWRCWENGLAWGAVTPLRPSLKWIVFPNKYGKIIDQRKTNLLKKPTYIYPSYCVPVSEIISKQEIIDYLDILVHKN